MKHKEFWRKNRKKIKYIRRMFIVVWFVFIIYCLINAPERCAGITQPIYGHEVGCDKDYGLAMLNAIFPTILFFLLESH